MSAGSSAPRIFRELLEGQLQRDVELIFIEKRRAGGVVSGGTVVGSVSGRTVIVLDDLCASGSTLTRAAGALREAGATAVHVAFTHAPLPRGLTVLAGCADISSIVTTDSVGSMVLPKPMPAGPSVTLLHVAPLLSDAVARIVAGAPLTPLLQRWPPIGDRGKRADHKAD